MSHTMNSVLQPKKLQDDMVGLGRVELPTSRLSGVRSNHLSYRPISMPLMRNIVSDVSVKSMRRKRNEDGGVLHNIKTGSHSKRTDLYILNNEPR